MQIDPNFGKFSFYSNIKGGGNIDIYLDGNYIGELGSYFSEGSPECGQSGTLSFTYKTATYSYRAENNRLKWSGSITVYENH